MKVFIIILMILFVVVMVHWCIDSWMRESDRRKEDNNEMAQRE